MNDTSMNMVTCCCGVWYHVCSCSLEGHMTTWLQVTAGGCAQTCVTTGDRWQVCMNICNCRQGSAGINIIVGRCRRPLVTAGECRQPQASAGKYRWVLVVIGGWYICYVVSVGDHRQVQMSAGKCQWPPVSVGKCWRVSVSCICVMLQVVGGLTPIMTYSVASGL
jgi:hypothetical protein